nr:MAG TPA: IseA DL-endopeptidase inhibitor [Bacteriophage sp.]
MTFQEAHKNGNLGLATRRGLTEDDLRDRLGFYFSNEEIDEIINSAKFVECWTDGQIAIICNSSSEELRFVAVVDGNYMKLIEP